MPKINVYVSDELAVAVRQAGIAVSPVCQQALEQAVRNVGGATAGTLRYTRQARAVLANASVQARRARHRTGTEHLALAILDDEESVAVRAIESLGVAAALARAAVNARMPAQGRRDPLVPPTTSEGIGITDALRRAASEAIALRSELIGTEHLLLGVLKDTDGIAAQALAALGLTADRVRRQIRTLSPEPVPESAEEELRRTVSELVERIDGIRRSLDTVVAYDRLEARTMRTALRAHGIEVRETELRLRDA